MIAKPRIAPHEHTGKVLPRQHTSFAGLLFLLLLTGVVLLGTTSRTLALGEAVNPQGQSIAVKAKVAGPPPTKAAIIVSPVNGQRFNLIPVAVSGLCEKGLIVAIYKNDVFGASTICDDNGKFEVLTDLFPGQNRLIARVFDALNQEGPVSEPVTVFYDQPGVISSSIPPTDQQILIKADSIWLGVQPGGTLEWPVEIIGGRSPYAVSWDWGDGKVEPIVRSSEGKFSASHIYDKPGNYIVRIRVSDSVSHSAFLQLVTIVNGAVGKGNSIPATILRNLRNGNLALAWPLYALAAAMIATFWFGEKYEVFRLKNKGVVLPRKV